MDSIDAKVNVKGVAIHLTLDFLPFSLSLQALLAMTSARSYSFNSSSSVSVWSDGPLSVSIKSSTLASLGADLLMCAFAGGSGRLAGRRGHSEIQQPGLPHRKHRF